MSSNLTSHIRVNYLMFICSLGGIGRHDRLKICSFIGYEFESHSEHHVYYVCSCKVFFSLVI